jgi:hypothetical protein
MTEHEDQQDDALAPGMRDQSNPGDAPNADATPEPGDSGPQGGQLGSAGGGYGTGSAAGTSGGTPDGEDVQQQSGPGPQTDWLRSAQGMADPESDELGR